MNSLTTLVTYYRNNKKMTGLSITEQVSVLQAERTLIKNKLSVLIQEDTDSQISTVTNQRQQLVVRRDQLTTQLNRQIELLDKQLAQLQQTKTNQTDQEAQQQPQAQQQASTQQQSLAQQQSPATSNMSLI